MDLTKTAALLVIAGAVLFAGAVAAWDWRAGAGLFGLLMMAAGIQSLRSTRG